MRIASLLAASVVMWFPGRAFAHPSSGGGETHDHRGGGSSGGGGETRDHRGGGSSSGGGAGETRDHRGSSSGDHDRSSGGGGSTYYEDGGGYYGGGYATGDDAPAIDTGLMPTWTWEAGFLARQFRAPSMNRRGSDYDLQTGSTQPGDSAASAFDLRGLLAASSHIYAGAELQAGGVTRSPAEVTPTVQGARPTITGQSMIGFAGLVGARARAGVLELDGELAAGVRTYTTTIDDGMSETANETLARPLVEARVRGVLWITSRWFLSAEVGAGAFDRSDVSGAILIGSTSRAFGDPFDARR